MAGVEDERTPRGRTAACLLAWWCFALLVPLADAAQLQSDLLPLWDLHVFDVARAGSLVGCVGAAWLLPGPVWRRAALVLAWVPLHGVSGSPAGFLAVVIARLTGHDVMPVPG